MDDDKAFEIIEATEKLPRLKRDKDGFSRQDVVNAYQRAFTMIGGVERLALWANANPDKFFPLHAKLLPSTTFQFGQGAERRVVHAIPPSPLDQHPAEFSVVEAEYVRNDDTPSE